MISVVCVYNNREILEEFLLKSLKKQSVGYELFLIDNRSGKFKSAAEALNKGAEDAKGKYIMFVHQDIDLKSDKWLENAEKILNSLDNLGIAGVAGRSNKIRSTVTNIVDGIPPKLIGIEAKIPTRVQTLDECLVIIPRRIFNTIKFDEKVCDDWHLYTVDYSLVAQKKSYDVYVIPIFLYHRSSGFSFSENYYITLEKLLKKHRDFKVILTTVGNLEGWITFIPLNLQIKFHWFKNKLIHIWITWNQMFQ